MASGPGAGTRDGSQRHAEDTQSPLRLILYTSYYKIGARIHLRGCLVCQCNKTEHLHPGGLLQPLTISCSFWSDIAMDFVEGFPKVGGKSVILTVVDRFSMYDQLIPLGHPYSATTVAKAFFDQVVRLHGIPLFIVSD
jgi:hypothetical protein